ncbi:L-rhamnose mutarotase [Arcticibacter tournemirensis]|uniref:L-rhamnose mutarotase n=1 Tax=Arcticibacter tournemirensis TaxID=699437 RepID=A0A5M9HBV5_9SPHI|nr:L-rhamnose mutarotase [Arcticibacter tournemirensis]KAA8483785.1 L-rhamnose mutarotase [Arcticibacter tournemirensis]TQM50012.1 L-rhamnose mutarotase [Arcticibacter tournemirensis]
MRRYCFGLDLKDNEELIKEYELYHKAVWPEIIESIRDSGITAMDIYRLHTRLFMIMETDDSFDFEKKAAADSSNERVREWEQLMWKYQQGLPWAKPGEKWMLMEKVFSLDEV